MKYFKLTQILKNKGTDEIVDECIGYVMTESLEECQKHEEMIRYIDPIYQIYDVQDIYEECSKEEYDDYRDRTIFVDDLVSGVVQ